VKLEANLVVAELAARQPRPFDSVLAFLDVLLRFASLIVEGHHPLGGARQVGDDEADTGDQFAGMPFDLGHHAPLPVPASSLISHWSPSELVGDAQPDIGLRFRTLDRDQGAVGGIANQIVGLDNAAPGEDLLPRNRRGSPRLSPILELEWLRDVLQRYSN